MKWANAHLHSRSMYVANILLTAQTQVLYNQQPFFTIFCDKLERQPFARFRRGENQLSLANNQLLLLLHFVSLSQSVIPPSPPRLSEQRCFRLSLTGEKEVFNPPIPSFGIGPSPSLEVEQKFYLLFFWYEKSCLLPNYTLFLFFLLCKKSFF